MSEISLKCSPDVQSQIPPFPRPELDLFMDFRFVNIKLPLNLELFFLDLRFDHLTSAPPPPQYYQWLIQDFRDADGWGGGANSQSGCTTLFCLPKTP